MTDVLRLWHHAHALHRREAVDATVVLLAEVLDQDRAVRDIQVKAGRGAVMVTMDDARLRLVMPSVTQAMALRDLWHQGPVTLAMGIALDDGRAMLGFSGPDEDVLVSARVSRAAA